MMLIKNFCEIYNISRRELDYWTRIGLVHPRVMNNGYREYDEESGREVQLIIAAKMLDYPGSLESKVQKLHDMDSRQLQKVLDSLHNEYNRLSRHYSAACNVVSHLIEEDD